MTGDLISAIRDKQQRIVNLRREILALEAELREAKAILSSGKPKREVGRVEIRKRPIRPNSTVWWAHKVLTMERKPLHIDDLVRRVEEFSGHSVRKTTLVSNLSRYVRASDTFMRPDEGVYSLIEVDGGNEGG